jgi:general secretion pathway protein C
MGFDAIFKRYFVAVVCLLIGTAAYFQASGMGALVASSVALDPSSLPVAPLVAPRPVVAAASPDHVTTAAAIISRNPFDSVTGPLDGKTPELPEATKPDADNSRDLYADPDCDVAKALLVVTSDDPQWSFAALAGSDGKSMLRRQGDEIGGYTVAFIGDHRTAEQRREPTRELMDRVWLTGPTGQRCQIRVGGKLPTKSAPKTEKPKGNVPKDIADKIHKLSES